MSSSTGPPLPCLTNDGVPEDNNNENSRPKPQLEDVSVCESEQQQQQQQRQQEVRAATTAAFIGDVDETTISFNDGGDVDETIISKMMFQPTLESLPIRERMKSLSSLFNQSSFFPLDQSTNIEEKEDVDVVGKKIALANVALEESALSASLQSESLPSKPGDYVVRGIDRLDGDGPKEEDEYQFASLGTGTKATNFYCFHHTHDDRDIMVEANVVDETAEEKERVETMNLRKELDEFDQILIVQTTSLRSQLEELKNENIALRNSGRRSGLRRLVAGGCTVLLLMVLSIIFLMIILLSKSTNDHNVSNDTPFPTAIAFESPPALPSFQPSSTVRPSLQPSLRPSLPTSMRPLAGPVEWKSIGGDILGISPGDWLGYHVDISGNGNRVAVVTYEFIFQHVRLYELTADSASSTESAWKQIGDDIFNSTVVDMDKTGNTIAVGNHKSDTVTTYTWNSDTNEWNRLGSVLSGHGFLTALSLSSDGRQLAVGDAYSKVSPTGQVVVYKWDDTADEWIPMGNAIMGHNSFVRFGKSVSLSGDGTRMVVGAALIDDMNEFNVGRVQVFEWDRKLSVWKQHGQVITGNYEAVSNELFGDDFEMSLDGTTIVVGASLSSEGGTFSGRAVVYRYDDSSNQWIQLGDEIHGEETMDQFGSSVSISFNGNRIAIGAHLKNRDNIGENVGYVRVFDWNGSNWIQSGNDIYGDAVSDKFGWSVDLSNDGTRMVASAIWHDCPGDNDDYVATRCGLVRVFYAKSIS